MLDLGSWGLLLFAFLLVCLPILVLADSESREQFTKLQLAIYYVSSLLLVMSISYISKIGMAFLG